MNLKNLNNILFVLIFLLLIYIDKFVFSLFMTMFAILSLRELLYVIRKENYKKIKLDILYYMILLFFVMNNYGENITYYQIDYKLLTILLFTGLIPVIIVNNKKRYSLKDAFYYISSTFFIGIIFNLLIQYRSDNINYCYYLVILSFVSKFFEYITTKYIGKTKILPTVTPKKTIEGVFGGVIISTIVSSMFFISTITTRLPVYLIVIMSFILCSLGKIGEFVFSFIKKEFNKSSFSSFFFGKSGILDVIDNNIFIILGFVIFVSIL